MKNGAEATFLRVIRENKAIGYGRMMAIISMFWYLELKERYGSGVGAFKPICLLPEDVEEVEVTIKYDPLFQEFKDHKW